MHTYFSFSFHLILSLYCYSLTFPPPLPLTHLPLSYLTVSPDVFVLGHWIHYILPHSRCAFLLSSYWALMYILYRLMKCTNEPSETSPLTPVLEASCVLQAFLSFLSVSRFASVSSPLLRVHLVLSGISTHIFQPPLSLPFPPSPNSQAGHSTRFQPYQATVHSIKKYVCDSGRKETGVCYTQSKSPNAKI